MWTNRCLFWFLEVRKKSFHQFFAVTNYWSSQRIRFFNYLEKSAQAFHPITTHPSGKPIVIEIPSLMIRMRSKKVKVRDVGWRIHVVNHENKVCDKQLTLKSSLSHTHIQSTHTHAYTHFIKQTRTYHIQSLRNSVLTNLVVNVHSVITNTFESQIGQFTTQINPVKTKSGYNEQKWLVP
jgi:hypothetical protein